MWIPFLKNDNTPRTQTLISCNLLREMVHHDPPPVKEKLIPNSQLAFPSFAQLDVISYNVVLSLASRNAAWHQAIQMAEVMATNDQAWEVGGMLWRSKRFFFEKEEDVASVMSPQI